MLLTVPATQRALTGRDVLWVLIVKRLLMVAITGLLMATMTVTRLGKQLRSNPDRADAFVRGVELQVRPHRRRRVRRQRLGWTRRSDNILVLDVHDHDLLAENILPNDNRFQGRVHVTNFSPIRDIDFEPTILGPGSSSADPPTDGGGKPSP